MALIGCPVNVGQFGTTDKDLDRYKQAGEYALEAKMYRDDSLTIYNELKSDDIQEKIARAEDAANRAETAEIHVADMTATVEADFNIIDGWVKDMSVTPYGFTAVGGEVTVTLPSNFTKVSSIYINGGRQEAGDDFTYNATTHVVTFTYALQPGDRVSILAGTVYEQTSTLAQTLQGLGGADYVKTSDGSSVQDRLNRLENIPSFEKLRNTPPLKEGEVVYLSGWAEGSSLGGGHFIGHLTAAVDDGGCIAANANYHWKRIVDNHISFDMYGADRTGTTSSYNQIKSALQYATNNSLEVIQSGGKFSTKGGVGDIQFFCPVNLTGATIIIEDFAGDFLLKQLKTPTVYDSSNESTYQVLSSLKSSDNLLKGTTYLSGWADKTFLHDTYVVIKTDEAMYQARGVNYNWISLNRVSNLGYIDSPFKYDMRGNPTEVYSLPINDFYTELKGWSFEIRNLNRLYIFRIEDTSRVKLDGFSITTKAEQDQKSYAILSTEHCYDIQVYNFQDPWPKLTLDANGNEIFSYTFNTNYTMELKVSKCRSQGAGWGAVNNTFTSRVIYEQCDLNRIDCHHPFFDHFIIDSCTIGRRGVVMVGCGDLHIRDSTFVQTNDQHGGFIITRNDVGGWFDGNLYIKNCTVDGTIVNRISTWNYTGFFLAWLSPNTGVVSGSQIDNRVFNNVYIDGLYFRGKNSNSIPFTTFWNSEANSHGKLKLPLSVNIRDMLFEYGDLSPNGLVFDFSNFAPGDGTTGNISAPPHLVKPTCYISLDNVRTNKITFTNGPNYTHNPYISVKGLKPAIGIDSVPVEIHQRGLYKFEDCLLSKFSMDAVSGVSLNMDGRTAFEFKSCTFKNDTNVDILSTTVLNTVTSFTNCTFVMPFTGLTSYLPNQHLATVGILRDCAFIDTVTGTRMPGLPILDTVPSPLRIRAKFGNSLMLKTATDGVSIPLYGYTGTRKTSSSVGDYTILGTVEHSDDQYIVVTNITPPTGQTITGAYIV